MERDQKKIVINGKNHDGKAISYGPDKYKYKKIFLVARNTHFCFLLFVFWNLYLLEESRFMAQTKKTKNGVFGVYQDLNI